MRVAEGSQGPRGYAYAEVEVWFSEEGLPGPKERLLARRSIAQEPELKYYRWDTAEILKGSNGRRERNRRAAVSHHKRRAADLRRRLRSRSG